MPYMLPMDHIWVYIWDVFNVFLLICLFNIGYSQPPSTTLKPACRGPFSGKTCVWTVRNFYQEMGPNGQVADGQMTLILTTVKGSGYYIHRLPI